MDLTVLIFGIDNGHEEMFIFVSQLREWIAGTFELTDSLIYSQVVHEKKL